jgi:hypothetical protein
MCAKHFLILSFSSESFKINDFTFKKIFTIMSYELQGKLFEKLDTVQRTESFKVREFVVEKSEEINGKTITNLIKFQATQDRTGIIDRINVGEEVKVHFNIRGSKWEKDGRVSYFNNLDAWRIEQVLQGSKGSNSSTDTQQAYDSFTSSDEVADDLPF